MFVCLFVFFFKIYDTRRFWDRKTTMLSQRIFSFKKKEKNIIFCLCHKNLVSFFFSSFNAGLCDCVSIWTVWLGPRLLYHLSSQHKKSKRCLDLPESSLPRWQQLLQFFGLLLLSVCTKTTPSIVVVHFTNTLFCCCFGLSQPDPIFQMIFSLFWHIDVCPFLFFHKFLQWIIKKFRCRKRSHLDLSYSALFHFNFFGHFVMEMA